MQKLKNTIIDNLVLTLQNVHIRYEDSISNPASPFSIGFTLESLTYQPCDRFWTKRFITLDAKKEDMKSYKLIEVENFSLYHISKVDLLEYVYESKLFDLMESYIATSRFQPNITEYYLIRPMSMKVRMR
jgi:vacuolar protein sorting-associated protein 13A/C